MVGGGRLRDAETAAEAVTAPVSVAVKETVAATLRERLLRGLRLAVAVDDAATVSVPLRTSVCVIVTVHFGPP